LALFCLSWIESVPGLGFLYQWAWLAVWLAVAAWIVWRAMTEHDKGDWQGLAITGGKTAIISIVCLGWGFLAVPWVGNSLWFLSTVSSFEGTVLDVVNDESADGGIRRTFTIQDHEDCSFETYVSRDLVIPPWIIHDDSARTRSAMIKGQSYALKEAGSRRYKNDMPVIGNFLWLGYLGDFSAWPNIYSAEKMTIANPCA
jgi:hypothetical protein